MRSFRSVPFLFGSVRFAVSVLCPGLSTRVILLSQKCADFWSQSKEMPVGAGTDCTSPIVEHDDDDKH